MKCVVEKSFTHDFHWLEYEDHVGYLCRDSNEQALVLLGLIESGIDQRKKIICLLSNHLISQVMEKLKNNYLYAESHIPPGQLILKDINSFIDPYSNFNENIKNVIMQEIQKGDNEGYPCTITAIDGSGITADQRFTFNFSMLGELIGGLNNFIHHKTIFFYSQQIAETKNFWEIFTKHPTIVVNGVVYRQSDRQMSLVSLELNAEIKHNQLEKIVAQRTNELAQTIAVLETEISKRQRIAAVLAESEQRYRALVDGSPVPIFVIQDAKITFCNREAVKMLGFSAQSQLIGKPAADLFCSINKNIFLEQGLSKKKHHYNRNINMRRSDGTIIYFESVKVPISYSGKKAHLVIGNDITERINAVKALKESKDTSRALIDAVDDALFLLNPDGTIVTANNEGFRRLGKKPEIIIGTSLYSYLNKKNAKEQRDFVERVIQTGKTIKHVTKQAKRILENTIYPIFNNQKKVIRLALYSRDISERVRIEMAQQRHAQEMDALYRTLLEITTHMNLSELLQLIVMRATTILNETSGTLYLLLPDNETLEAVVSYNQDKDYTGVHLRLGEGISGKIAQTKQPMFISDYANWEERPKVYSSCTTRRVLGIPLKLGDQVIGVINVSSNIKSSPYTKEEIRLVSLFADQAAIAIENTRLLETVKRDLKERIQISKALEASLAEKEVMLREIHHRVKNNLNVIIALLDLQEDSAQMPNAKLLFNDLKTRVRTMALVHENLYQSANLGQVDFARYLKKLIDFLLATYPTFAPVQIDIDIPAISMDIDNAIPCGLIVNELVTNSLKYAFPANRQSRATHQTNNLIRVALHQEDQQFVLSVSDNGIGFPPDINWQETNTLGLLLVATLTKQLNGTIQKLSDEGSTFVIRFQRKKSLLENNFSNRSDV